MKLVVASRSHGVWVTKFRLIDMVPRPLLSAQHMMRGNEPSQVRIEPPRHVFFLFQLVVEEVQRDMSVPKGESSATLDVGR